MVLYLGPLGHAYSLRKCQLKKKPYGCFQTLHLKLHKVGGGELYEAGKIEENFIY